MVKPYCILIFELLTETYPFSIKLSVLNWQTHSAIPVSEEFSSLFFSKYPHAYSHYLHGRPSYHIYDTIFYALFCYSSLPTLPFVKYFLLLQGYEADFCSSSKILAFVRTNELC